jgi:hypothetical protein
MNRRFGKLSKVEREKIELEYHRMNPDEFDEPMSRATTHTATSLRLPDELVEVLKVMAKLEGEHEYQAMVRKWIEERPQHETELALRLSKLPLEEVVSVLKRQVTQ